MTAGRLGRVAFVCTDPGVPVFGRKGSSMHARAVLAELVQRADEVHLLAARFDGQVPAGLARVRVHELPRPRGEPAARERALVTADAVLAERLHEVGTEGLDLVYQRYALWSCAGLELAERRGWRSVLEINAPLVDEQADHRNLVDRDRAVARTVRAVRAATTAYAVSDPVAAWAADLAGRPVAIVPNGVDAGRFAPRADLPRQVEDLTIGFVGTFKPWHGLDDLVAAAAAAHASPSCPPVRLLLIGDGPGLARVSARAARAGLGGRVECTGSVDPDDVPALLRRVDVAVAPYPPGEHYFSPLKVFEYLAAGVPVVASDVAGLAGLVRAGEEALLVPAGDGPALAAAVERLCADAALRGRLGVAGRLAAERRLGWATVVDRVLALAGPGQAGRAA